MRRIIKAMLSVTFIIVTSKILGFLRQMVTAQYFGTTIETDLVMLGQGLVMDIEFVFSQTLITSFVPIYLIEMNSDIRRAKSLASEVMKLLLFVGCILTITMFVFAPIIARVLAPTYSSAQSLSLTKYIHIYSLSLVFILIIGLCNALLKANEQFVAGEMLGIYQSVSFIVCIILLSRTLGIQSLIIAFFIYQVISFVILLLLSKQFFHMAKGNPLHNHTIKKLLRTTIIVFFGYSMVFLNQQVDKIIVSGLGEGKVTAVYYAAILSNFICTFIASMGGILFTYITNRVVMNNDADAASLSISFTRLFLLLLTPICMITEFYSNVIVSTVFGRGQFDEAAVSACAMALKGYAFGFMPFVVRELYGRLLYAYEESKHVTRNSTISILINVILSILLSMRYGVMGVTVASSISIGCCALLNFHCAKKRNNYVKTNTLTIVLITCSIDMIICFLIMKLLNNLIISEVLRLLIVTCICLGVSFAFMFKDIVSIISIKKEGR